MRWTSLILGLLMFATQGFAETTSKPRPSIQLNVEKYQLPNGITVLLHQDRSAPVVSYQTFFKVGSRDEEVGYTGIAHLFEHMMFKGAKRYTNDDFDRKLRASGASYNAFTTYDMTGYYITLPSHQLELAIDLESDRMENLQMTDAHLKSEREVVKEERRFRYDNSVSGTLYENLFSSLYTTSNYRWPVIGYMEDLNRTDLAKCKDFFRRYYSPNNAIIVVAGDFEPAQAKKWIQKYYAHMKPQELNRPPRTEEAAIKAPRVKVIEKDIQTEVFSIGFHSQEKGATENYALDLLAAILADGTSSRLYNKVVRDSQLADSVNAYNYPLKEAGSFIFNVNMKSDSSAQSREKVIKMIEGEIWRARNQLVSAKELEKAKTNVMMGYVDSLKRIEGRASLLAHTEVYYGDYNRIFQDLDKYQGVTADQIRAAAQKYLDMKKSATVIVTRKKSKAASCESQRGGKC